DCSGGIGLGMSAVESRVSIRAPGDRQLSVLAAVAAWQRAFPGAPLPSRSLLARFLGTSKEVVADAIRRLRARGLLVPSGPAAVYPRGWAVVGPASRFPELPASALGSVPPGVNVPSAAR